MAAGFPESAHRREAGLLEPPGGLPATVSSGSTGPGGAKRDDKAEGAKKGCAGMLLLAGGAAAAAASALIALVF